MKPIYNQRARFDYDFNQTFEAGLALLGTEVKSVKAGNISLKGAFITVHGDEVYLTNATIPPWQIKNAPSDYDPTRSRKLLLRKVEIKQISDARQAKGLTVIPVRVYTRNSKVKMEIALARGRKKVDKKKQKKERDIQRDVARFLRGKA